VARTEIGPDTRTYYRRKHQHGQRGQYWLHQTEFDVRSSR
jgi:hypothetical protein